MRAYVRARARARVRACVRLAYFCANRVYIAALHHIAYERIIEIERSEATDTETSSAI